MTSLTRGRCTVDGAGNTPAVINHTADIETRLKIIYILSLRNGVGWSFFYLRCSFVCEKGCVNVRLICFVVAFEDRPIEILISLAHSDLQESGR